MLNAVQILSRSDSSQRGKNNLRRTISKLSSAVTGFQTDSIRPKVFSTCFRTIAPSSSPTSAFDSGSVATTIEFLLALAASVNS